MRDQPEAQDDMEALTPSARVLMARARQEALQLQDTELRPEHLLLAMLEAASLADQRNQLRGELTTGPAEPTPTRLRPNQRLRSVLDAAAARSTVGIAGPRDLLESIAREDVGIASRWLQGPAGNSLRSALSP